MAQRKVKSLLLFQSSRVSIDKGKEDRKPLLLNSTNINLLFSYYRKHKKIELSGWQEQAIWFSQIAMLYTT